MKNKETCRFLNVLVQVFSSTVVNDDDVSRSVEQKIKKRGDETRISSSKGEIDSLQLHREMIALMLEAVLKTQLALLLMWIYTKNGFHSNCDLMSVACFASRFFVQSAFFVYIFVSVENHFANREKFPSATRRWQKHERWKLLLKYATHFEAFLWNLCSEKSDSRYFSICGGKHRTIRLAAHNKKLMSHPQNDTLSWYDMFDCNRGCVYISYKYFMSLS